MYKLYSNSLFGDNTTGLSITNINPSTYLYEAMIESVKNDFKLFEEMMKSDALEIKYKNQGINEARIQQLREATSKSIGKAIGEALSWLAKKLSTASEAFFKLMDKAMEKIEDGGLPLKAAMAIKKPENLEIEVTWYNIKFPINFKFVKEGKNDIMPLLIGFYNGNIKDDDLNNLFIADNANSELFTKELIGVESLDAVTVTKKVKDIPELAKDGGLSLFKQTRSASKQIKNHIKSFEATVTKLTNNFDSLFKPGEGKDQHPITAQLFKMLGVYKTNVLSYYNTAFDIYKKEVVAIKDAMVKLVGKSGNVNEATIDMIIEESNRDFDYYLIESDSDTNKDQSEEEPYKKFNASKFKEQAGQALQALFEKIIKTFWKVISSLENRLSGDEKFIEKYKADLFSHPDKINNVSFKVPSESVLPPFPSFNDHLTVDEWNKTAEDIKSHAVTLEEVTIKNYGGLEKILGIIKSGKKDSRITKIISQMNDAKNRAKNSTDKEQKEKLKAYANVCSATVNVYSKFFISRYKGCRSALIKAVGEIRGVKESTIDLMIEAAMDDVDQTIATALSSNVSQNIEDVSLANTDVVSLDVSTDPNTLVYDKTDCYSQDTDIATESFLNFLADGLF